MFRVFLICCLTGMAMSYNVRPNAFRKWTTNVVNSALVSVSLLTSPTTSLADVGNIGAAINAILDNPDSLLCNLDNQNIQEGQSSCQQLDNVVRYRGGKLMTIRQDWGGSASTGAAIWNGANMATWYVENVIGTQIKDKSVVEIGAGVGLTSLVANAMGATTTVITDGNEDVLKLADQNIDLNTVHNEKQKITTARLRWNSEDEVMVTNILKDALKISSTDKAYFDYIIASDVTYKKAAWNDLMACIAQLTGPQSKAILSMEPRNVGEVEGILALAEKYGLAWTEESLPINKDDTMCGMMCARLFVLTMKVN